MLDGLSPRLCYDLMKSEIDNIEIIDKVVIARNLKLKEEDNPVLILYRFKQGR